MQSPGLRIEQPAASKSSGKEIKFVLYLLKTFFSVLLQNKSEGRSNGKGNAWLIRKLKSLYPTSKLRTFLFSFFF